MQRQFLPNEPIQAELDIIGAGVDEDEDGCAVGVDVYEKNFGDGEKPSTEPQFTMLPPVPCLRN